MLKNTYFLKKIM